VLSWKESSADTEAGPYRVNYFGVSHSLAEIKHQLSTRAHNLAGTARSAVWPGCPKSREFARVHTVGVDPVVVGPMVLHAPSVWEFLRRASLRISSGRW
jgi:hypothetical protein